VDTAYLRGRDPVVLARQLCDGGSDILQLRAKASQETEIRALARRIRPVCAAAGVHFVINDHPAIARETGASLCHLGQEDFFDGGFTHASQLSTSNTRVAIGLSTHSPEQAGRALAAQPAYIAIGPVFATPTKPGRPPVTLDYVRWAAANVRIPWFAIGGITADTLDAVLDAGATRVCIVSAILNAPDVAGACRRFKDLLLSTPPKSQIVNHPS
jgi:thiamine-phosphate pyrophosphorylase